MNEKQKEKERNRESEVQVPQDEQLTTLGCKSPSMTITIMTFRYQKDASLLRNDFRIFLVFDLQQDSIA